MRASSKHPLLAALLILLLVGALVFSFYTLKKVYSYTRLNKTAPISAIEWLVVPVSFDRFTVEGAYRFEFNGKEFGSSTIFYDDPQYNAYAASRSIPFYQENIKEVWFDSVSPEHSSLQKKFPLKECISTGFLFGLLGYFFWLTRKLP